MARHTFNVIVETEDAFEALADLSNALVAEQNLPYGTSVLRIESEEFPVELSVETEDYE